MKKIIWNVIFVHICLVCWLALWIPSKEIPKKSLKVSTVSLKKPITQTMQASQYSSSTNEVSQQPMHIVKEDEISIEVVKNVAPPLQKSKPVQKKAPSTKKVTQSFKGSSKKPQVPHYLINQLQESIAKIEQNRHKEVPLGKLNVPSSFFRVEGLENDQGNAFAMILIDCFQKQLHLPEVGEVKVALTLRQDGSLVDLKLLSEENQCNAQFLEKALRAMRFPSFKGEIAKQKEHTFVITFCNR